MYRRDIVSLCLLLMLFMFTSCTSNTLPADNGSGETPNSAVDQKPDGEADNPQEAPDKCKESGGQHCSWKIQRYLGN